MKNISFSPPDITSAEINEVVETLRSGWITTGPRTKKLERIVAERCHTSKAVCLNSNTACAEMTLRLLGVGPEDEVIVPAYTYTATASVAAHVGAKIVMIDCGPDKFTMDYDGLESAVTEKTKVIIPVDLFGIPADYERILKLPKRNARSSPLPTTTYSRPSAEPLLWVTRRILSVLPIRGSPSVLSPILQISPSTPSKTSPPPRAALLHGEISMA